MRKLIDWVRQYSDRYYIGHIYKQIIGEESMLYRVLKRTIQRGQGLEDMEQKLDIFLAANKITLDQYEELLALLHEVIG